MAEDGIEIKDLHGSSFFDVMGDSPRNRILDFLASDAFDYTLKEIAKNSHVGYATIKRIWHHFIDLGLVKQTRKVGKAVFYKYDNTTPYGKLFKRFYLDIIISEAEKEAQKYLLEKKTQQAKILVKK